MTMSPTLSPARMLTAARPGVTCPARNSSERPDSSSPRNLLVAAISAQIAPTMVSTASVRHAVNPRTVSSRWLAPKSAVKPGLPPNRVTRAAREAAVL